MLRKIFLILIVLSVWIESLYSFQTPVENTIASVEIVSESDVDRLKIMDILAVKEGDIFRTSRLSDGVIRLSETGFYDKVETIFDPITGILRLNIQAAVYLDTLELVIVKGDDKSALDVDELRNDLTGVTGIAQGDILHLDVIAEVRNRVRKRLFDRGFENARVVVSVEDRKQVARKLVVSINLGKRSVLRKLNFKNFNTNDIERFSKVLKRQFENRGYRDDIDFATGLIQNILAQPIDLINKLKRKEKNESVIELKNPLPMDWITVTEAMTQLSKTARESKFYDYQLKAVPIKIQDGEYSIELDLNSGKKYRVDVVGNTVFWERDLKMRLLDKPQRLGIPFSVPESEKMLKRVYAEKGYASVEIQTQIVETEFVKNVVFQIKEGIQYVLGEIKLIGLDETTESVVRRSANTWLKPLTSILRPVYLDEELLRSRLGDLVTEIRSQGYLQTRILDFRVIKNNENRFVEVEISFQVGPLFRVREVEVVGDSVLGQKELKQLVTVYPGDPVNPVEVVAVANKIFKAYQNLGFLNVQMPLNEKELLTFDLENNLCDIKYPINSGAQILVGGLIVQGNKKTQSSVVTRELKQENLSSGRPWSPEALRRSEQRLSQLGLFGSVKFESVGGRNLSQTYFDKVSLEQNEKDMRITVEEMPPGAIEFGPGYRTDLGLVGFAELNYRNLFGFNRGVSLRAQVSRKLTNYQFPEQKYSATFLEPYFLGWPLRFRTSLSFTKEDQIVFQEGVPLSGFNSDEVSLGFAFDKSFSERLRVTHRIYEISRPRIYDIVERDTFQASRESYQIGSFGTTIYFDTRNNFFNPSKGWYLTTGYDVSPRVLGTDVDASYFTLKQTVSHYLSLGREGAVFALSLQYAHIWGLGQTSGIPETKRLVLGGRTSIRSFAEQSIRFDDEGVVEQNSFEIKAELRQPIVMDFGVAFFVDVGEVKALKLIASDSGLRSGIQSGVGFGIRYSTAVGPLSLDFAVNPNADSTIDPFRLQFSIGSF